MPFSHCFARAALAAAIALALGISQRAIADDYQLEDAAEADVAEEDSWLEKSAIDDEESRFLSGDSELGLDDDLDSEDDSFVTSSFSYLTGETALSEDEDDDSDVTPVEWSAGIDFHKGGDKDDKDKKPSVAPKGNKVAGAPADAIVDLDDMAAVEPVADQVAENAAEGTSTDASDSPAVHSDAPTTQGAAGESVEQSAPVASNAVTNVAAAEDTAAPASENAAATTSSGNAHDGAVTGPVLDPAAANGGAGKADSEEIHDRRHDESAEFQRMMR